MRTLWALYREHSEYGYPDVLYGIFDSWELAKLVQEHLKEYARKDIGQASQRLSGSWLYYQDFSIEEVELYSSAPRADIMGLTRQA